MKISEIKNDKTLHKKLSTISCAVKELEACEFQYALNHFTSSFQDESKIQQPSVLELEKRINDSGFYKNIELKPEINGDIILDKNISELTAELFAGIISGNYDLTWINQFFYFDVRGFIFIPRTVYFTQPVLKHLQKKPYRQFEKFQSKFESFQGIGYRDFKNANYEIDNSMIYIIRKFVEKSALPVTIGIAGPTAAGKTEVAEYLQKALYSNGKSVKSLEMDNFFLDRDYREMKGIGSMKKESLHFKLLLESLTLLQQGKSCKIPAYNQLTGESSHDNEHRLKEGKKTVDMETGDIIYVEGNFPFLFREIIPLIDLKIMYLTDDPVRLKRKWKRDIDYRKKYEPEYLCNRYFRTQFLKAKAVYLDQLEICDIAVDTTNGCIWLTEKMEKLLN